MRDNHTSWENLSTPALEKLLSADFLSEEDTLSPEELHEISEVIAKREMDAGTQSQVDVDNAWEAFLARVKDLPPEDDHSSKTETNVIPFQRPQEEESTSRNKGRKKIRWNISIAAILCILILILVIPASASERLEDFVHWTSDTFSYPISTENNQISDSMDVYETLEDTVDGRTSLPILPKYFPEGTTVGTVSVNVNEDHTTILSEFTAGEIDFYFLILIVNPGNFGISEYEKNDGPVEEYVVNGISHYIMGNYEQNIITWRNENVECAIYGYLSTNDLKKMVKSIYD